MASSVAAVVLAAGRGTRMRSDRAKVLHPLGGLPLVNWVTRSIAPLVSRVVVVVGHEADAVRRAVEADAPRGVALAFAEQREQLGTGHAVAAAREAVGEARTVLVLSGDVPRIRTETVRALLEEHAARSARATVLTFRAADPTGYGRVLRSAAGTVTGIVEQVDATPDERLVDEVNSGSYAFDRESVFPLLDELPVHPNGEIYVTDVVGRLVNDGETVAACVATESEVAGVNTQAALAELETLHRVQRVADLHEAGVTVVDPAQVRVDVDVEVGAGSVIAPFVSLEGGTRVGAACDVGSFVRLRDVVLGDGCTLRGPLCLEDESVPAGTVLGPG